MSWKTYFKDTVRSKFNRDLKLDAEDSRQNVKPGYLPSYDHRSKPVSNQNLNLNDRNMLIEVKDEGIYSGNIKSMPRLISPERYTFQPDPKPQDPKHESSQREPASSDPSFRIRRKGIDFPDYSNSVVEYCRVLQKESQNSASSILSLLETNSHLIDKSLKDEVCRRAGLLQAMALEFDTGLTDIASNLAHMVVDFDSLHTDNARLKQQVRCLAGHDYWGLVDMYEDRVRSLELQIGRDNEINLKECLEKIDVLIREGAESDFEAGVIKLHELKKEILKEKSKQVRAYINESDRSRQDRLLQSYSFVNRKLQEKLLALLRYDHSRDVIVGELQKMVRSLQCADSAR